MKNNKRKILSLGLSLLTMAVMTFGIAPEIITNPNPIDTTPEIKQAEGPSISTFALFDCEDNG